MKPLDRRVAKTMVALMRRVTGKIVPVSPVITRTTTAAYAICAVLLAGSCGVFAQDTPCDSSKECAQVGQPSPSLLTPLKSKEKDETYQPITDRQRLRWLVTNTIGPPHLAGGVISAAFGTALNRPYEYGSGWGGFADRFGMRLTGVSTGNAMEAGIGWIWKEDPRYFRVPDEPFKSRLKNIVRQTFYARRDDASFVPAYARYAGIIGNNFISNSWRVQSEANNHDAVLRSLEGFAGRMASNAFEEFWPDVRSHLPHRR